MTFKLILINIIKPPYALFCKVVVQEECSCTIDDLCKARGRKIMGGKIFLKPIFLFKKKHITRYVKLLHTAIWLPMMRPFFSSTL